MDLRTGCAYWLVKNGLLASYPRLTRAERADVAVVGAGVTGAAAAYRLSRAGFDVVVVDGRDVASGSTAASTGLLLYETDASLSTLAQLVGLKAGVRSYELGREAIDRIEATAGELDDPCGFARRACLYLASSDSDVESLQTEHSLRRAHGFNVDFLSAGEVLERFGLRTKAALYGPGQGEIDCYRFAHRLLAAAVRSGARVYDRTEVTKVRRIDGRLELMTADGIIRTQKLIWATGYETVESLDRRTTNLNSTWACATEPLDRLAFGLEQRCLIWETARPYFYLRTTEDGRVLMGGEDSRYSRRHENRRLLEKKAAALLKRFHEMFPGAHVELAYSWAGVFAETRDALPYVSCLPDDPDVWYALGYGGNGITFGVVAADLLHDALTGASNPDLDLFRLDRGSS